MTSTATGLTTNAGLNHMALRIPAAKTTKHAGKLSGTISQVATAMKATGTAMKVTGTAMKARTVTGTATKMPTATGTVMKMPTATGTVMKATTTAMRRPTPTCHGMMPRLSSVTSTHAKALMSPSLATADTTSTALLTLARAFQRQRLTSATQPLLASSQRTSLLPS